MPVAGEYLAQRGRIVADIRGILRLGRTHEERVAEGALFRRGLEAIRRHFDPKTWQAFWRVTVDGLSAGEAAAELGMRPGTVRVAKSRVLQRLRRHLGDVE